MRCIQQKNKAGIDWLPCNQLVENQQSEVKILENCILTSLNAHNRLLPNFYLSHSILGQTSATKGMPASSIAAKNSSFTTVI